MDLFLYIISGVIAVGISIWFFLIWQKQETLRDTHPLRYGLLIFPAAYFLLIAFSGWAEVLFLRMDLLGLILFILLGVGIFLIQGAGYLCKIKIFTIFFSITTTLYFILGLGTVIFVYMVKFFPLLGVRVSTFFQVWEKVDLFKILWEGLGSEKENMYNMVIKIFIALFTYVPLTLFRIWYMTQKINILHKEIEQMKQQLGQSMALIEELRNPPPEAPPAGPPPGP